MNREKGRTARIESYKDLLVWKSAIELAVKCYAETNSFPGNEAYGMTSQIRRSATSIAANIAEGYGREHTGSFIQFLRIAQGSLKELETHLVLSERVGLMGSNAASSLATHCEEISKMLRSLIRSLQQK